MKQPFLRILLVALLIGPLAKWCYAQDEEIKKYLETTHTFNTGLDTLNSGFLVHKIDVVKTSLLVDGEEWTGYLGDNTDLIDSLLSYKAGKITEIKRDSTTEYYKVVTADSVLCLRFASIHLPLGGKLNVDSIYTDLLSQMQKGIKWNNLSMHPTCGYNSQDKQFRGQSHWTRAPELLEGFVESFIGHAVGDVFIVKDYERKHAWIVYKTDKEQLLERKQILLFISPSSPDRNNHAVPD